MKRVGWAVMALLLLVGSQSSDVYGVSTMPSDGIVPKVNGPLLITGYSFSGHSLRYVQVYNSSDDVVSLDGWQVTEEYAATSQVYKELAGNMAPKTYVTVANEAFVPTATFLFADAALASDPTPTSISLRPPVTSNFTNEAAQPSITSSTPRTAGSPATFNYARNISTTTGNFLTSYTAFIPGPDFMLLSDGTYTAPAQPDLRVIEVFPDARSCSPFETDPTCTDYVKIQNQSGLPINLALFRLRTGQFGSTSSSSNTVRPDGLLEPGHSASFSLSLSSSGSWVWLEDAYGVVKYESTALAYPSSSGHDNEAWSLNDQNAWQWTSYPSPGDATNTFPPAVTVNKCEGLVINEIAANVATEDQYVELRNATDAPIDLTGCVIQTNRSTISQYVFEPENLAAGALKTVYIKDTELTLTKTTTGTVYVLSSDLANETNSVSYENLGENTAWANLAGVWAQTYSLTPNAENVWQQYPACESGYERNLDTGLCNKISGSTVSSLIDCGAGKERNPETNRCRTIASTSSLLVPCAPNQERSPDTNRCRATQSSTSLAPCAANQERNPDTNRCRNKSSSVTSDFPVQAVAQSGEATIGWWAFGGVGTLAVGYAGWEWRREVLAIIKKATSLISSRS